MASDLHKKDLRCSEFNACRAQCQGKVARFRIIITKLLRIDTLRAKAAASQAAPPSRRRILRNVLGALECSSLYTLAAQTLWSGGSPAPARPVQAYPDGRPAAKLRLEAKDAGPIIRHAQGPASCDYLGAREAICFRFGDIFYLYYDGAGPTGWRACLAVSRDLRHWDLKGPVLDLGEPGDDDAGTASSPWTVFDGASWHMFYVGSRSTTPAPNRIPAVPYFTLAAKSAHPQGPWVKQRHVVPFRTKPGTYYADTASPGQVVKEGDEYLMFFSAAHFVDGPKRRLFRTVSIARTRNLDGPWEIDSRPAFPPEHQIENSALFFEPANRTWFLFTDHIGVDQDGEYTESIWVYWSGSLNNWDPEHRAVVLDERNCKWSTRCIGMPSVVPVGGRLALFYDASTTRSANMGRDVGLAWLERPLKAPEK